MLTPPRKTGSKHFDRQREDHGTPFLQLPGSLQQGPEGYPRATGDADHGHLDTEGDPRVSWH